MRLNKRKQAYIQRLAGYATNPVQRALRVQRGREQQHAVGGHLITLPPEHDLPFYQRRDPTYDAYAAPLLADLAARVGQLVVIDIGANVGDTAVLALTSATNISVVSVEGSKYYARYARRNLAPFGERATLIEGFVGPIGNHTRFVESGTTGGFVPDDAPRTDGHQTEVDVWVSPTEIIASASGDLTVWKSDIDGFDIHVLVQYWAQISTCPVIWFEYDPVGTLGEREDVDRLIELIGQGGYALWVFDNLGRRLLRIPSGSDVAAALSSLTAWLRETRQGYAPMPYLDVWLFAPQVEPDPALAPR